MHWRFQQLRITMAWRRARSIGFGCHFNTNESHLPEDS